MRALEATPSWFGTVNSTVSAARTASSAVSSAAMWSGSDAVGQPWRLRLDGHAAADARATQYGYSLWEFGVF